MNRVLIYEPDLIIAQHYQRLLESNRAWVLTYPDKNEATTLLEKQLFHFVIWNIESKEDVSAFAKLKEQRPETAFIGTSKNASSELIVAAMRAGASHFYIQQENLDGFDVVLKETISKTEPASILKDTFIFPFSEFVGRHPKIIDIFQTIMSIRNTDSTVLITGESGTGKEIVARAIHYLSQRTQNPLVAVNCGAIPCNLIESELFGHVKGAFTGAIQNRMGRFQKAANGTLFLDEIGDLSLDLQAKLLRAIQSKVYEPVGSVSSLRLEARIIAATNLDLEKAVFEKRFREDLYYRLNVIPIVIPPLRSRKSDIPLLTKSFMDKFSKQHAKNITGISKEAMECLIHYQWPGNIRELENLLERVILLKRDEGILEVKDLPIHHFKNVRMDRYVANIVLPEEGLDFDEAVNDFENELILQALHKTAGNKNRAATLLNLNRTTLVEKLKRKGLRIAS